MEFLNFNRIFWNLNKKYIFFHKLCKTKLVDIFETNKFVFFRFFRILHIIVKKLNFGFSLFFFLNYKEKYASCEKMLQFKFVGLYVENNIVS